jgi:hypothetical protein
MAADFGPDRAERKDAAHRQRSRLRQDIDREEAVTWSYEGELYSLCAGTLPAGTALRGHAAEVRTAMPID